jgi:hypothetical protein
MAHCSIYIPASMKGYRVKASSFEGHSQFLHPSKYPFARTWSPSCTKVQGMLGKVTFSFFWVHVSPAKNYIILKEEDKGYLGTTSSFTHNILMIFLKYPLKWAIPYHTAPLLHWLMNNLYCYRAYKYLSLSFTHFTYLTIHQSLTSQVILQKLEVEC